MESMKLPSDEIKQEIAEIEDFTREYWLPALEEAKKHTWDAPDAPDIIEKLIESRKRYVCTLKEYLIEGYINGREQECVSDAERAVIRVLDDYFAFVVSIPEPQLTKEKLKNALLVAINPEKYQG